MFRVLQSALKGNTSVSVSWKYVLFPVFDLQVASSTTHVWCTTTSKPRPHEITMKVFILHLLL